MKSVHIDYRSGGWSKITDIDCVEIKDNIAIIQFTEEITEKGKSYLHERIRYIPMDMVAEITLTDSTEIQ